MGSRFADHILPAGLTVDRPLATDVPVGTLYPSTDDSIIYQSDGAAWSTWADMGGGGGGSDPVVFGRFEIPSAEGLTSGSNFLLTLAATYDPESWLNNVDYGYSALDVPSGIYWIEMCVEINGWEYVSGDGLTLNGAIKPVLVRAFIGGSTDSPCSSQHELIKDYSAIGTASIRMKGIAGIAPFPFPTSLEHIDGFGFVFTEFFGGGNADAFELGSVKIDVYRLSSGVPTYT